MTSFFSVDGGPIWIKFRRLVQNQNVYCGDVVKIETRCRIPIWRTFGRIQWPCHPRATYHTAGCCHLIGDFTVTIPEPHATLQSAVTWRNQCHDRVTLQDARIPSAILKIVFRQFYFLMQFICFDERRLSYRFQYSCCTDREEKSCFMTYWLELKCSCWS